MTDCTTEPLLFSSLKRQSIQADFRGGRLTSDGGALLLREADRSLGLILDFDPTDDPVHGNQEMRFFHGY